MKLYEETAAEVRELALDYREECQPLADEVLWVVGLPDNPFAGTPVHQMSEGELMRLIDQMQQENFFETENRIREAVEQVVRQWENQRHAIPGGPQRFQIAWQPTPTAAFISANAAKPSVSTTFTLRLNLPEWLSVGQARWLAERQIREQIGE